MNPACKFPECESKASYGFRFAVPEYCREHGAIHKAKSQFQVCLCGASTPRFKLPEDERASCCAKCKTKDMINCADRRCECTKHLPTYGLPEDARAKYCSECKKDGMINLKDKNKKCECGKVIPSFGMPGGRPSCCVKCKKEGMINLTLDLCECGKSACYGIKGDKRPSRCLTHKKEGMENIVTKKCKCGKAIPVFGKEGDKKATCCLACKTEGMINIGSKKCICGSAQPSYGYLTDTNATCCVKCKKDNMVDIRSVKCKCGKSQPVFGKEDDKKATCCVDCKTADMKNIKAKMCKCGKSQPFFGLPTDKKATCCSSCKGDGMIDILSANCPTRKCKGTFELQKMGLKCPYEQHGKKKYDYYCTACFEQNFPDDERTYHIRDKTEEIAVRDFLNKIYIKYPFTHNKALWTGHCTCRRRIDFHKLIGNTMLCIEVDEDQHKYRDKEDEILRYDDLMMIHGGKFVFIRYNPHLFIDSEGKRKNPSKQTRLQELKKVIDDQTLSIYKEHNIELLEIVSLFYDAPAVTSSA